MGARASCCACNDAGPVAPPVSISIQSALEPRTVINDECEKMLLKSVLENSLSEREDRKRLAAQAHVGKRKSVCAASIKTEDAINYVKPVYQKDASSKAHLQDIIRENSKLQTLTGHLGQGVIEDIVNAFKPREALQGEVLIRQGDEGDCLFLLEAGEVDVFVARPTIDSSFSSDKGSKVASLGPGALFGELALMHQAPRAATVIATSSVAKLWQLDREPFRMLLVLDSEQRYQMYQGWLREVEAFKCLNNYELMQLSDCLESEVFDEGETVFDQGAVGDRFYILEGGSVAAYISGPAGEAEVKAYNKVGEYFGERALLKDEPRAASVRATGTGAQVVSLSKDDFTKILGPIHDILSQHVARYPQYIEMLK